jgi:hypothetical protein
MNGRVTRAAIFGFTIGLIAVPATTEEVSIKGHNKDQVQGKCDGDGDVYWTQGKTGHTYGCMHADGSGIVCSGVTAAQKKTCSTFKTASFPKPNLPTREEAAKAAAKPSGN